MRTVVFRADASPGLGAGHVHRCLGLAAAYAKAGWKTALATDKDTASVVPSLAAGPHDWCPLESLEDGGAADLAARFPDGCDLLAIDHYGIDSNAERGFRPWAQQILAFDDDSVRTHATDFLVDAGGTRRARQYRSRVGADCQLLLGPGYAPLRPGFWRMRMTRRSRSPGKKPERVFVGLGATDPKCAIPSVLSGLGRAGFKGEADIVLSSASENRDAAEAAVADSAFPATLHIDHPAPERLMVEADFAIGAGGIGTWERCCLGLSGLLIISADNQAETAGLVEAAEASLILDGRTEMDPAALDKPLRQLVEDPALRQRMEANATMVCDGLGSQRIVMETDPPKARDGAVVRLRPARPEDCNRVLDWQRAGNTRRYFRNPTVPEATTHRAWFADKLSDRSCVFNIIMHGDTPVGVVRLDGKDVVDDFDVSIFVAADWHQLGLASAALALVRRLLPDVRLHAQVLPENTPSQRLFLRAGYVPSGEGWYLSEAREEPES